MKVSLLEVLFMYKVDYMKDKVGEEKDYYSPFIFKSITNLSINL